MAAANDNPPGGAKPPGTLPVAPGDAEIHADAEAARRALALDLAEKALKDPGSLDPKRLMRLGSSGLAVLVEALRADLPAPQPVRSAPVAHPSQGRRTPTAKNGVATPARTPICPSATRAAKAPRWAKPLRRVTGWWDDPPSRAFESSAYRRGLFLGFFLILGLVTLFQHRGW